MMVRMIQTVSQIERFVKPKGEERDFALDSKQRGLRELFNSQSLDLNTGGSAFRAE
jgi:hypothetical protein